MYFYMHKFLGIQIRGLYALDSGFFFFFTLIPEFHTNQTVSNHYYFPRVNNSDIAYGLSKNFFC